jgi:Anti-sigma-K factor rskA
MDRELTPDEIMELLPSYALDAVDDDERAAIDLYLEQTPEARAQVAELQVAASMLAQSGGPPPEGVWERLETAISTRLPALPSKPPPDVLGARRAEPRPPRADHRWQWFAVAAAVVALAFGGLWLAERSDDGSSTTETAALARAAARAPGSRHVVLADDGGTTLATAVVARDGTGYLTSKLPPAAVGKTYQLWDVSARGTISLGVLGRDPKTIAFKTSPTTRTLAITTEAAGGVPVTRHKPDAVGDLA